MTVRELIEGAMKLIGAIAAGETASASEAADGLVSANLLLDSWSNENLVMHTKVREEVAMVAGTATYTMGTAGTFSATRALKIEHAGIERADGSSTLETPLRILNQKEWADIYDKELSSEVPQAIFADGAYPVETITVWPEPTAAHKLVLYSWKALTQFASVNTTISLPPGYLRALRYNLALEIAPEYGKDPSALVMAAASESKENIKRMNAKPHYLAADEMQRSSVRYDIFRG